MLSDSLIIGLVIILLCSAVCFYMYIRIMFLEKKVSVMESILVDVRVALDSIMTEQANQASPTPITHTPGVTISAPAPLDPSESETIPEENFYSSVLEQAHEVAEEQAEEQPKSFDDVSGSAAPVVELGPNFDSMTRAELLVVAQQRGLHIKRSANRAEVLAILRRPNPTQNDLVPTGAENVSGSVGNTLQLAASLDGSMPVDLGTSI